MTESSGEIAVTPWEKFWFRLRHWSARDWLIDRLLPAKPGRSVVSIQGIDHGVCRTLISYVGDSDTAWDLFDRACIAVESQRKMVEGQPT